MQIDLVQGMMDCLYAECTPCITDCVMAELEKLGQKYRVALKIAKVSWGSVSVHQVEGDGLEFYQLGSAAPLTRLVCDVHRKLRL